MLTNANENIATESPIEDSHEIPIIEIFGPTLQGEGALAGQVTHFIRTGGCGYRCSWCDTMYAVDPKEVKKRRTMMNAESIAKRIETLGPAPWVTLSGGDPCLHKRMNKLISLLHKLGHRVSVETQGQFWQDWLHHIDQITISPKPPSSGMGTNWDQLHFIVDNITHGAYYELDGREVTLKIVVFNEEDFDYARATIVRFPYIKFFLSAGTPPREPGRVTAKWQDNQDIITLWNNLANAVMNDKTLKSREPPIVVGCQQHVLLGLA